MRMHSVNRAKPFSFVTLLKTLGKNMQIKGTSPSPSLEIPFLYQFPDANAFRCSE
jgi:hypothetical protein